MSLDDVEDSPIVKLVNMMLLNAIKKKARAARVRVDGPTDYWLDGAWVEEMIPPAKLRPRMIDRIKEMADIPDDAPLHFDARLRLLLGKDREQQFDITYSSSEGGGVALLELRDDLQLDDSDVDVMRRAWIMLEHAGDALARDEVRARIHDAVTRVKDQPGRRWFLRNAARTSASVGLYDDALELMSTARTLNETDARALVDIDSEYGTSLVEMNRTKEGEEALRRSLAIAERLPRPTLYELYPLLQLAKVAMDRGDLASAERDLGRIDDVVDSVLGPASAVTLLSRAARVRLMRQRGDATGADKLANESLESAERYGLVREAAELQEQLADGALARGDAKDAIEHLREVLQLPSRSPMRASVYASLARAQRAIGRDADAVSSLRAAVALVDGSLALDHPIRIDVERELATLTATAPYR